MEFSDVKSKPHARNIIKKLGRKGKFGPEMTVEDIIAVVSARNDEESEKGAS